MGACVSHNRDNHAHRRRRRRRQSHSTRSSTTSNCSLSLSFCLKFDSVLASGTVGRNKPLNRSACRPRWKSDVAISENQLRRKREEYWDTGEIL